MKREADDAHLDAALNPALLVEASQLNNTLLQEGGGDETEEADAVRVVAARPLAAPSPPGYADVVRRIVARWRAFVAERMACPLLDLLLALPDLFEREVLKRLDPVDRTMLAQVGRPWRAAVLAAAGGGDGSLGSRRCWLPRLPKGVPRGSQDHPVPQLPHRLLHFRLLLHLHRGRGVVVRSSEGHVPSGGGERVRAGTGGADGQSVTLMTDADRAVSEATIVITRVRAVRSVVCALSGPRERSPPAPRHPSREK
jgi:hypothetical protein